MKRIDDILKEKLKAFSSRRMEQLKDYRYPPMNPERVHVSSISNLQDVRFKRFLK